MARGYFKTPGKTGSEHGALNMLRKDEKTFVTSDFLYL